MCCLIVLPGPNLLFLLNTSLTHSFAESSEIFLIFDFLLHTVALSANFSLFCLPCLGRQGPGSTSSPHSIANESVTKRRVLCHICTPWHFTCLTWSSGMDQLNSSLAKVSISRSAVDGHAKQMKGPFIDVCILTGLYFSFQQVRN